MHTGWSLVLSTHAQPSVTDKWCTAVAICADGCCTLRRTVASCTLQSCTLQGHSGPPTVGGAVCHSYERTGAQLRVRKHAPLRAAGARRDRPARLESRVSPQRPLSAQCDCMPWHNVQHKTQHAMVGQAAIVPNCKSQPTLHRTARHTNGNAHRLCIDRSIGEHSSACEG